jgi:transaldolase
MIWARASGSTNITRGLLKDGTLRRYIGELSITGFTSNPSIFDHAIKESNFYDDAIHQKVKQDKCGEALFFELAIEDLRQAADLFRPVYDRTNGIDGWVSLEVSPTLAYDTPGTIVAVERLHVRAERPNLFVKIPGTPEGIPAIRGVHLCRCAGECDPALFAQAISGGGGSLFARHRAAHPSGFKS